MTNGTKTTLQLLMECRQSTLHVIDPYKIPLAEAVEKARAIEALQLALLLVGSTDYTSFESHVPPYLAALKRVVDLKLLLHFPPRKGYGVPLCEEADAVLLPCVLNSADAYFAGSCLSESRAALAARVAGRRPEAITSAAFVFGPDQKSFRAVGALPLTTCAAQLRRYADEIRASAFDLIYLYSRHGRVSPEVCRFFREHVEPHQLLFVSGGVDSRGQVAEYLDAGADYVVFGTALERFDWRERLDAIACPPPVHSQLKALCT